MKEFTGKYQGLKNRLKDVVDFNALDSVYKGGKLKNPQDCAAFTVQALKFMIEVDANGSITPKAKEGYVQDVFQLIKYANYSQDITAKDFNEELKSKARGLSLNADDQKLMDKAVALVVDPKIRTTDDAAKKYKRVAEDHRAEILANNLPPLAAAAISPKADDNQTISQMGRTQIINFLEGRGEVNAQKIEKYFNGASTPQDILQRMQNNVVGLREDIAAKLGQVKAEDITGKANTVEILNVIRDQYAKAKGINTGRGKDDGQGGGIDKGKGDGKGGGNGDVNGKPGDTANKDPYKELLNRLDEALKGNKDIDSIRKEMEAMRADMKKLLNQSRVGTDKTTVEKITERVVPGATNTIKETNTVTTGKDGKDGRDAPSQAQSGGGNAPQQAPEEGGRSGYEAKDIMDSQTDSHGSFKMARNVAIVCAILFILSGGAIGIFLLGALLGGAAAVYYDDKMQTEKQQIAKRLNIEQGLVDPAEYRQQQMEKQMSQGMRELQEQLAHLSKDNAILQQQFQDLFQQSAAVGSSTGVTAPNPSLTDPAALTTLVDSRTKALQMTLEVHDQLTAAVAARSSAAASAVITSATPVVPVSPTSPSSSLASPPPPPPPPPSSLASPPPAVNPAQVAAAIGATMGQENAANAAGKLKPVSKSERPLVDPSLKKPSTGKKWPVVEGAVKQSGQTFR